MKLEILARRDSQSAIRKLRGDLVAGHILPGTQNAPRKLGPHHQDVLFPRLPFIPIILLISAVKLQELELFFGKMGSVAEQGILDITPERVTLSFDFFTRF